MEDRKDINSKYVIEISPNEFNYWESCRRKWAYKELDRMAYQKEKERKRKRKR